MGPQPMDRQKMRLPIAVAICLSVGTVGVFWFVSEQHAPTVVSSAVPAVPREFKPKSESRAQDAVRAALPKAEKADSVELLLGGLQARLEQQPDDVDGWVLLGKSYHHLGRWEDAEAAFEKAKTLGYTGTPPSINSAVPNQTMPGPRQSPLFAPVDSRLIFKGMVQSLPEDGATGEDQSSPAELKIRVTLSPSLLSAIPSDTAVFVFARNADARARSRAPLAVTRAVVGDLPIELKLDDSMAMVPGESISSASSVVVGARVALSGNPVKQPADLEILSSPVSPAHKELIELTIPDNSAMDF